MMKISVNMGNNLRKSYSKHESHARMFATARPDLVVAGRRRQQKKRKKKIRKKKLGQNYKASVRHTGCLTSLHTAIMSLFTRDFSKIFTTNTF